MIKFLFILYLIFSLYSCDHKRTNKPLDVPKVQNVMSQSQKDSLSLALAMLFNSNPQTKLQEEENELIGIAMENGWPVVKDETGIFYTILKQGNGELLDWKDKISAHYRGTLVGGKEFDSSYKRGKPLQFYVGNMIPGFAHGLKHFRVGSQGVLLIPSYLAYGNEAYHDIPPNSPLIFEIEVLEKIEK